MSPTASVWVLGEAGLDDLASALAVGGASVERLEPDAAQRWVAAVAAGEAPPALLPNLLVAGVEFALDEDPSPLRTVKSSQPWGFLPFVVVAQGEDPVACGRAYDLGASSFVVLPEGREARGEVADAFARFWLETTRLPQIDAHARL